MDMYPPSDNELKDLPHVVLTADMDWDPTIVDNEMDIEEWLEVQMNEDFQPDYNAYGDNSFNEQGYYRMTTVHSAEICDPNQDISPIRDLDDIVVNLEHRYRVNMHEIYSPTQTLTFYSQTLHGLLWKL
jgi:hypothetical protein